MVVRATSDLHGTLPEIEPCDLLIVAGDVCPHPTGNPFNIFDWQAQLDWLNTEFRAWLRRVPAKRIVGIAGNHDFVFEKLPEPVKNLCLPWTYLEDSEVTIDGLRIYGTPWTPKLQRWAFHMSDHASFIHAESIPEGLDILISHGPPRGHLDFVAPMFGSTHVGDIALAGELPRIRPRVLVCGHIHEQHGVKDTSYGTTIYNVSLNNEHYEPVNEPVLIERI